MRTAITGLNQKVEQLEIITASNGMFIQALESQVVFAEVEYQQALSYIGSAEYIMENLGVKFYYTGRR